MMASLSPNLTNSLAFITKINGKDDIKTSVKENLEITSLLTKHSVVVVAFKLVGAQTCSALVNNVR